jgi:hypothetical protein
VSEHNEPHPLVTDTWIAEDDSEYSTVHTHRIAETTRAANGIKVISRIVHNSLGQPDMSGAQPLDVGSVQHLMNALECLGDYIYDQLEDMRDTAARYAKYEQQSGAAHG